MQLLLSPGTRIDERYPRIDIVIGFLIQVVVFLELSLQYGASNGRDVDEVLAVWASRLPSASAIIDAIWNGVEYSPPTYDLILHQWFALAGDTLLTSRLPAIAGMFAAALLAGLIVWRRLGPALALLVVAFLLASKWFYFALQARPYGLWMFCAMLAVWFWDGLPAARRDIGRIVGLALALSACGSLHFYAILTFGALAMMEVLETLRTRQMRLPVWAAILVAGLGTTILWGPLSQHLAQLNEHDASSASFSGAPTFANAGSHLFDLTLGSVGNLFVVLAAFLVLGASFLLTAGDETNDALREPPTSAERENRIRVAIIGLSLICVYPAGMLLALLHTHVFAARYALTTCAGVALLCALALGGRSSTRPVCVALSITFAFASFSRTPPDGLLRQALAMVGPHLGDGKKIVVGDGWLFIPMLDAADPQLRAQLVYLSAPVGSKLDDSVMESQVLRLSRIFPNVPVFPAAEFIGANPDFNLMCGPSADRDFVCRWLMQTRPAPKVLGLAPPLAFLKF